MYSNSQFNLQVKAWNLAQHNLVGFSLFCGYVINYDYEAQSFRVVKYRQVQARTRPDSEAKTRSEKARNLSYIKKYARLLLVSVKIKLLNYY